MSIISQPPMMDSLIGNFRKITNKTIGANGDIIAILIKMRKRKRKKLNPKPDDFQPVDRYEWFGIPISARLEEVHNFNTEITRHAVENGVNIQDHAILQPIRLDFSFEVSNFESSYVTDDYGTGSGGFNKTSTALQQFTDLWQSRDNEFSILTTHQLYQNMVCTSFTATNNAEAWGRLIFHASFQQVKYVNLTEVTMPPAKVIPAMGTTSEPKNDQGTRSPSVGSGAKLPKVVSGDGSVKSIFNSANQATSSVDYLRQLGM